VSVAVRADGRPQRRNAVERIIDCGRNGLITSSGGDRQINVPMVGEKPNDIGSKFVELARRVQHRLVERVVVRLKYFGGKALSRQIEPQHFGQVVDRARCQQRQLQGTQLQFGRRQGP
jgi:hypothetical protein